MCLLLSAVFFRFLLPCFGIYCVVAVWVSVWVCSIIWGRVGFCVGFCGAPVRPAYSTKQAGGLGDMAPHRRRGEVEKYRKKQKGLLYQSGHHQAAFASLVRCRFHPLHLQQTERQSLPPGLCPFLICKPPPINSPQKSVVFPASFWECNYTAPKLKIIFALENRGVNRSYRPICVRSLVYSDD